MGAAFGPCVQLDMIMVSCVNFCFLLFLAAPGYADVDVEDLIVRGYTCSLADTNQKSWQRERVINTEVVCDDGICIECVLAGKKVKPSAAIYEDTRGESLVQKKTPRKVSSIQYPVSRNYEDTRGESLVQKKTTRKVLSMQYPVSRHFLDEAEDFLDDGYSCGLTPSPYENGKRFGKERVLCEGGLCLVCKLGILRLKENIVALTSENVVEVVKDLVDRNFRCFAVLDIIPVKNDRKMKTVCDTNICFVCRT